MKKRYTFKEVREAATLAGYKITAPMYSASGKTEIEVIEGYTAPDNMISEVSKLTDAMKFITNYPAVKAVVEVTEEVEQQEVLENQENIQELTLESNTSEIIEYVPQDLGTYSTKVASGWLTEVPVKSGCATTRWLYKYKYKVRDNFVTHCMHVPKYLVEIAASYIEQSAPVIRILEILGKVGDLRMPMQRHLYPKNWDAIAFAIKESANWKCVCCGKPCRRPKESLDAFYSRLENTPYGAHVPLAQAKPGAYVLTVAHLNHKPSDCGIDNLRAYCSVCHLNYDKKHHAASRKANQIKKSVQI